MTHASDAASQTPLDAPVRPRLFNDGTATNRTVPWQSESARRRRSGEKLQLQRGRFQPVAAPLADVRLPASNQEIRFES